MSTTETTKVAADGTTAHIKGDWMIDGLINNLGRPRRLEVTIVDGVARDVDDYGHPLEQVKIDHNGELVAWGAGIAFSPDDGELERLAKRGITFGKP